MMVRAPSPESATPGRNPSSRPVIAGDSAPIIPRALLFGNPDRSGPSLSPDGRWLAWLAPVAGVLNVWLAPVGELDKGAPVTFDTHRGIRTYFWTFCPNQLVYMQDQAGDENWHLYRVDVVSLEVLDLTPYPAINARVEGISSRRAAELLLGMNDRNAQHHDLYRVNVLTGARELVLQNDRFVGFVSDADLNVQIAAYYSPDGSISYRRAVGEEWVPFLDIPQEDALNTRLLGFDRSGTHLYLGDSRGRDTAALMMMDMATGEMALLAQDERADVDHILTHPQTGTVQAVCFTYDHTRWVLLDKTLEVDVEALSRVDSGDLEVVSRTWNDATWVVAFTEDSGPVSFFLWERDSQKATFLFTNRTALEGLPLARMKAVVVPARDGLSLVTYLTLPVDVPLREDGLPEKPLPLVLNVHGGPWARDLWGFNAEHQWLANRGYAVISVNYRGSTGFGKNFLNKANMEWGGKMHDDLLDVVAWAEKNGVADARRVCVFGGSYGGYATLVGLTFTPDVFACGVDLVGPSNLITLIETFPPYWKPLLQLMKDRVGDPTTEEGRAFLLSRSPLSYVDRIKRPLLIVQGANDPRVKKSESDQIVVAMQTHGIPVTYALYPDEGHGLQRPENKRSFYAVAEAFLATHLGGRCEPVGSDFEGASLQVKAGLEHVPLIAATLQA